MCFWTNNNFFGGIFFAELGGTPFLSLGKNIVDRIFLQDFCGTPPSPFMQRIRQKVFEKLSIICLARFCL